MKFEFPDIKSRARYIDPRYYKHLLEETGDQDFYKAFLTEQFILRDHLAIDRTMLANESTFLAYIRTGLAMSAAGATLVRFGLDKNSEILGSILVFGGVAIFLVGVLRYRAMKRVIHDIRNHRSEDISKLKDTKENI